MIPKGKYCLNRTKEVFKKCHKLLNGTVCQKYHEALQADCGWQFIAIRVYKCKQCLKSKGKGE